MAEITLDQALPLAMDLAGAKANAFVHRCRLPVHEREDVRSQLVLTFLIRWPKYDSRRASIRTFAARVMDKEIWSIVQHRSAYTFEPLKDCIDGAHDSSVENARRSRVDFERALAPLPPLLRETAQSITWASTVETAERFGCSRQTVNSRKREIRGALLAAGIGPDYFVRGGAR